MFAGRYVDPPVTRFTLKCSKRSSKILRSLEFFGVFVVVVVVFSSELSAVELDDEGGRTFLRVLIHLIMQEYPPLVSGSLQLLFKHFSQRAEVLQAFKQVATQRGSDS